MNRTNKPMPKHRKNKPDSKKKDKKQEKPSRPTQAKPGQSRPTQPKPTQPKPNVNRIPSPEDFIDDDVSAAVAAYFSGLDENDQATVAAEVRRLLDALGDNFEIIGQDDDDEDLDVVSPGLRPKVAIAELLHRLIQEREDPDTFDLYAFSDLTLQDAETVRQQWALVDVARRRLVVSALVELANEDIDLDLCRFLRVVIGDSDAEVRRAAITGLWEDVATDLVGPMVQALQNDADEGVRAAAATALGGYILAGELDEMDAAVAMRAEQALLAVLSNEQEPLEVRRRALESIAYSSETGVRQLIEDGYYDSNEAMRVSAVFAMGRSADVRWRSMVRAELQSPSAEMRAEAAIATGELGAKSAALDVSALLQDVDERVRLAAIVALGRIGGPVAQDALETMLLSDNPFEAEAADIALEEMQFFDQMESIALFDELDEEDAEWESDAEDDEWYDEMYDDDLDDDDLGEYEDDLDDDSLDDDGPDNRPRGGKSDSSGSGSGRKRR
jgi:HEAT repeat protein